MVRTVLLTLSVVVASAPCCAQNRDVNAVNEEGNTPLCAMVDKAIQGAPDHFPLPDAAMVRELLEKGADPNIPCSHGAPPLILAAMGGETFMIEALLDHGADVNYRDNTHNLTPHGWCYMSSSYDAIELMESRGAPVSERIKEARGNVGLYFEIFAKLLADMPEGLSLAERAQHEYDASLAAQREALALVTNKWDRFKQILMMNQAKGRRYERSSGMDPREWRWHTRWQSMRAGMEEMYDPSMIEFGPENPPALR